MDVPIRPKLILSPATCTYLDCDLPHHTAGYCGPHYGRSRAGTDMDAPIKRTRTRATEEWRFVGTGADGYTRVSRKSPDTGKIEMMAEHRFVMSGTLGRPLTPEEHVHHLNGVRADNRPENLELWSGRLQPTGARVDNLVEYALEVLRLYAPETLA